MAEYINVKRPDGKTVTVSRKLFDRHYRTQGYEEVKASSSKKTDTKKGNTDE